MKKIFFSFLAIAAIASCAKTEAVFTEGDSEIKLSPVTKLQTKANFLGAVDGIVYPTAENFDVYAYWKNVPAGEVFTDGSMFLEGKEAGGAEFTNKGNFWGGVVNYYWPKNGSLRFSAYSPSHLDVDHQLPEDLYTVEYEQPSKTAETWDFLVAPTSPSYSLMTATEKVAIEFQHALSWITLKVVAKDADAAKAFNIKKVTINDVLTKANFAAKMGDGIQYEEWLGQNTAAPYVVFEGSQMVTETLTDIETTPAGTLVIPQNTTSVTVDFDQYGVNGTADTPGMSITLDLVLDQDNEPWRPGKHYNYTLIFGLDQILINPSVVDWEEVPSNGGGIVLDPDAINVSTAAQLEAALANDDATKIVFQNDIEGSFIVPEVAGRALTIDGNGYKLTGAFQIDGESTYAGATTVYKNIDFVTEDASLLYDSAFIYCGTLGGDTSVRYPDNVIIENCTFTAKGAAVEAAVAAKFWSLDGKLAVEGCSADALHSFMQLTSCGKADVSIVELTTTNCKNGVSLGDAGKVAIRKSNIAAREYGIRANGGVADTQIDKETTIAAKQPVIVRNVTKGGYVLTVDQTTLTPATAGDYQIIFTKNSDDKPYEAPTADFTLNCATTYKVFPTPEGWATNAEELAAALTSDKENISVVLTDDIVLPISSLGQITGGSGEYKLGGENTKNITIDLNEKKLTIGTTYWSVLGAKNDDALFTIKNGTMTSEQATGTWNSYDLSFANCNYNIENVVFEKAVAFSNANNHVTIKNVTISETHDYYAMWITAEGQNINIDGLTINSDGRGIKIDEQYIDAPAVVNMMVKNSTFKTAKKAAILAKTVAGANITLENVNIADVDADKDFAVWVDEDAAAHADKVVVNGGLCKVEGANVAAADTDAELREALKNGNDVILTDDINTTDAESNGYGATGITINGGVFDGNGHTIEVEGATSTWDSAIAIKGGTIKNVTVAKGFRGIFFKNGTEKIVLENVIIDGPTYTISCDQAGKQGFEAYNSKFYGWTSYAGTIGTGYFEGCTFGAGAGYNFSRPYAPTTYVNCAFEAGHKIDARAKVSFENCTLDGVALTAANINDLVTGNRQNIESVK